MMRLFFNICTVFFLSLPALSQIQYGFADPGFNNGNTLYLYPQTFYSNRFTAMAISADGDYFVAGKTMTSSNYYDFNIFKIDPAGKADSTFGTNGAVYIDLGSGMDLCEAIDLQSSGNILLAGSSASYYYGAVVRLKPDGSLDSAFASNGKLLFNYQYWSYSGHLYDIKVASDDRFYVTGYQDNGSAKKLMLIRFKQNGVIDSTFGNNGYAFAQLGSSLDYGQTILLQYDGKVMVIGQSFYKSVAVRFNNDGTLDSSYGSGGFVFTDLKVNQTSDDKIRGAFQSNGKLVITAYNSNTPSATTDMGIVRLTTEGKLDSSFGTNAYTYLDFDGGRDTAHDILITNDDRIFIGGYTYAFENSYFALAGFTADGQLNTNFAFSGMALALGYRILSMKFDGDRIVAGGYGSQNGGYAITRFQSIETASGFGYSKQEVPIQFSLEQNYPNPFNPETKIEFDLPNSENISLTVFNAEGKLVANLAEGIMPAGKHSIRFNGSNLASGIYFYRLNTKNHSAVKKMMIIK